MSTDPFLALYSVEDLTAELESRRNPPPPLPPPDPTRRAFRVTLDVLSLNGDVETADEVVGAFDCGVAPEFITVIEVRQKDLLSWDDDHPMNKGETSAAAHEEHFKDAPVVWSLGGAPRDSA